MVAGFIFLGEPFVRQIGSGLFFAAPCHYRSDAHAPVARCTETAGELDSGQAEGLRLQYTGKEDDPAYENRQFEYDPCT